MGRFGARRFRRQAPIGRYIVDFVCFEACLVIEVDGAHHYDRRKDDGIRDTWLNGQGFRVLRFSDRAVLTAIGEVESAIWSALNEDAEQHAHSHPHPNPPPQGGRGSEAGSAGACASDLKA